MSISKIIPLAAGQVTAEVSHDGVQLTAERWIYSAKFTWTELQDVDHLARKLGFITVADFGRLVPALGKIYAQRREYEALL